MTNTARKERKKSLYCLVVGVLFTVSLIIQLTFLLRSINWGISVYSFLPVVSTFVFAVASFIGKRDSILRRVLYFGAFLLQVVNETYPITQNGFSFEMMVYILGAAVYLLFAVFMIMGINHTNRESVKSKALYYFLLVVFAFYIFFSGLFGASLIRMITLPGYYLIGFWNLYPDKVDLTEKEYKRVWAGNSATGSFVSITSFLLLVSGLTMLEGHIYGEADKYGDYARGLYASEVTMANSTIYMLIVMFLVSVILYILFKKSFAEYTDKDGNKIKVSSQEKKAVIFPMVISAICTVAVIGKMLLYD